ncbi:MAG TPA: two-component regulator propeller domain-containing protein, partial [Phnomibacter sp.]|nr:two-component regulator propeller domain-containing protein [Phnomibacter sp.]
MLRRTVADGMSDNYISYMAEDPRGFVWLATANGLDHFNGSEVKRFFSANSQLPASRIYMVKNIPGNKLLLGTEHGVMIMHTPTGIVKKLQIPAKGDLAGPANEAERVFFTPDDKILVATRTGVFAMDTTGMIIAKLEAGFTQDDVAQRRIYFVLNMDMFTNGDALLSTTRGYYFYHHASRSFEAIVSSKRISTRPFRNFIAQRKDSYIFNINRHDQLFFIDFKSSTSDSLFVFDFKRDRRFAMPLGFQPNTNLRWDAIIGFHDDTTLTITANRNGLYHAVLDTAIMQWRQSPTRLVTGDNVRYALRTSNRRWLLGTETGLLIGSYWKENIRQVSLDRHFDPDRPQAVASYLRHDGKIWIGINSNTEGLLVLDSTGSLLKKIEVSSTTDPYDRNKFRFLQPWSADSVLAGTAVGSYLINTKNFNTTIFSKHRGLENLPPIRVTAICRDKKDHWWISLAGNGVWIYDPKNKRSRHLPPGKTTGDLPLPFVHAFAEDAQGNMWMAHQSDGMVRWNPAENRTDHILRKWPGWPSEKFDCTGIVADPNGSLWCFINGKGLYRYFPQQEKLEAVALLNERGEDEIQTLVSDSRGKLWLNLRHGIAIYDTATHQLHRIGPGQGLPGQFNTGYGLYED